ncbi:MAG: hypothetical protein ABEI11_01230 [Haloarculaceae archaeon]
MSDSDEPADLFDDLGVSGLLTRSDRELLLGTKTYDDPSEERRARKRLRDRVRTSFRDFRFLTHHLPPRDRIQLLGDVTVIDPEPTEEDVFRADAIEDLIHTLAFLYTVARDIDLPFERALEHAIIDARTDVPGPWHARSVEVTIEDRLVADLDAIVATLGADQALSDAEYRALARLVVEEPERVVDATAGLEIDLEAVRAAERPLSRGASLVVLARLMAGRASFRPSADAALLHDRVREEFGLTQFFDRTPRTADE